MKKYLIRVLLFGCIYIVTIQLVRFVVPFYMGNVQLVQKMPLFKKVSGNTNTLVFGNSLINRQFNPLTFDEYTLKNTKTFNLATDGTPFEECAYLIENFLKTDLLQGTERIILMLSHAQGIRDRNLHTYKTSYYHDFKRMLFGIGYRSSDEEMVRNHYYSTLENYAGLFRIKRLIEYNKILETRPPHGLTHAGYEPASKLFGGFPPDVSNVPPQYIDELERWEKFKASQETERINKPLTKKEQVLYDYAIDLKNLVESKGIKLHYLFLPNDILFFRFNIPGSIYLGDGPEFPEYFYPDNRFNAGHLNDIGAELYTKRIAEKFNELK